MPWALLPGARASSLGDRARLSLGERWHHVVLSFRNDPIWTPLQLRYKQIAKEVDLHQNTTDNSISRILPIEKIIDYKPICFA
jgi:hypothetical protein